MKKIKLASILLGILFLTTFSLMYIKLTNDHKECSYEVSTSLNDKGESVKVENTFVKRKSTYNKVSLPTIHWIVS